MPLCFLKKRNEELKIRVETKRDENEIERNADCFRELISRTLLRNILKEVVSGCIDSLPRRLLNGAGISFAFPATNLSNLLKPRNPTTQV